MGPARLIDGVCVLDDLWLEPARHGRRIAVVGVMVCSWGRSLPVLRLEIP